MSATPRFIIKVFLYQIEPEIWRRFSIAAEATFKQLHDAVQQAMGWEDRHWHEFRHGKGKRLLDVIGPDHEEVEKGDNFQEESKVTLKEFVGRRHFPIRFLYRYDFKDGASKPVELDAWSPTHKPSFHVPEYFGMGTMLPPSSPGRK